jgi:hypothetical protein
MSMTIILKPGGISSIPSYWLDHDSDLVEGPGPQTKKKNISSFIILKKVIITIYIYS